MAFFTSFKGFGQGDLQLTRIKQTIDINSRKIANLESQRAALLNQKSLAEEIVNKYPAWLVWIRTSSVVAPLLDYR